MTNPEVFTAIQEEIARIEGYLATLREKVNVLRVTTMSAPDDGLGTASAPRIPVFLTSKGAFHPRGFWFAGEFHHCSSQIDIYIGLLRALAEQSDDALPQAAAALRALGHSRCYLATDRAQLFPSQTEKWARAHSHRVVDGWYADSNLSLELKQRLLQRVFNAVGLREGIDVVILWRRTPASGAATDQPGNRLTH